MRRDVRFEANISEYERIFIRFEENITGLICLVCIEANWLILHAKRIKKEANIPF